MRRPFGRGAVATAALAVIVAAATQVGGAAAQRGVGLKQIGSFDNPVYVTAAPGAPKLLFVVEQPGTISVLRDGKKLERPFLNISNRVEYGGEEGLLSMAFDPAYERNKRFYVYFTNKAGNIEVDILRAKNATRASARSREKVIEVPHPQFSNHNGGQLQFGPDKLLYIGTGDGGSANDPDENAQNKSVLLGKLLRIDPRKRGGYSIPRSNPFRQGKGKPEIYATGLRNPYRFSFDSRTGDIWIGDVGQNEWEEIDKVSRSKLAGANFGWDLFEGTHTFEGNGNRPNNYEPPVFEFSHAGGNCSVTGGYVVRDNSVPALDGRYVFADFCAGDVRSLNASNPSGSDSDTGLDVDQPSSFGVDARGRVYVASLAGPVYRITQN